MPGRGQLIGKWGEDLACAFLERHGFFIKERNFFSTVGELDIVATKNGDYYFIEVKTRKKGELATDLAITPAKKRKLQKTARKYCYLRDVPDTGLVFAGLLVAYDSFGGKAILRMAIFE